MAAAAFALQEQGVAIPSDSECVNLQCLLTCNSSPINTTSAATAALAANKE